MRTFETETLAAGARGVLDTGLAGIVAEVLETMFFECPIGALFEGRPPCAGLGAAVEFKGARAGRLEVDADAPAAQRLAASFLGREDDSTVTGPEVRLMLLELANIMCGTALSRLQPQGGFQLAEPRLILAEADEGSDGWLVAPLESGRLAVRLFFNGA